MLKTDLEIAYNKLKEEHTNFKERVVKGMKQVIDDTCSESREHIETFCAEVGIPYPKRIVRIEIPYGRGITEVKDEDWNEMEFEKIAD